MKKSTKIIAVILALVLIAGACGGVYFLRSPEYTAMKIIRDVEESGMEGLRPYLTEDLQKKADAISSITNNKLVNLVIGLLGKEDLVNTIVSELKTVQWEVEDIMKGKNQAVATVHFQYEEKISGTMEVTMIRDKEGWKISAVEFPQIDKINW